MILPDSFFLWPEKWGADLQPAIDWQKSKADALFRWQNLAHSVWFGDLFEIVALRCREENVSPAWVWVCAQREQGCLNGPVIVTPDNVDKEANAAKAWLGLVGQNTGRAVRPGYYGIVPQLLRTTEQSAWLLGNVCLPVAHWSPASQEAKQSSRYKPGIIVSGVLQGETRSPMMAVSAGVYLQLTYTPDSAVLEKNSQYVVQKGLTII
jgi:hypothetical protein